MYICFGITPALYREGVTKSEMDSQRDAGKQIKPIVSPSLLPNRWEMNDVKEFYDENFDFMQDPEWLPLPETKITKLSLSVNKGIRKTEQRTLLDAVDSTVRISSRFGPLLQNKS